MGAGNHLDRSIFWSGRLLFAELDKGPSIQGPSDGSRRIRADVLASESSNLEQVALLRLSPSPGLSNTKRLDDVNMRECNQRVRITTH